MTEFAFTELLPADHHAGTPYRLLTTTGVEVVEGAGRRFHRRPRGVDAAGPDVSTPVAVGR